MIALQPVEFAFDARQLGPCCGNRRCRFIPHTREFFLAGLEAVQRLPQFRLPCRKASGRRFGCGDRLFEILRCREGRTRFRQTMRFPLQPLQPRFRLREFGIGHSPFRLHPGLIGGGLGERQFRRPAFALCLLERGGEADGRRSSSCARISASASSSSSRVRACAASFVSRSASP